MNQNEKLAEECFALASKLFKLIARDETDAGTKLFAQDTIAVVEMMGDRLFSLHWQDDRQLEK